MTTIKIAQINLQHKRTATINLCRLMQNGKSHVALVQEPYFRKGNFYLGNLVNPTFATFSKSGMTSSRVMPRACVLVNNAIVASLISEITTRDVCAVTIDVTVGDLNRKYVYCSVYLPHDEPSPTDDFKKVIAYCDTKGLPLIVSSDANAHHIIWGSSDINPRGSSLMEYLSSTNLAILNTGNRPTFMVSSREEVLDITLCTNRISHELDNWHVSDEESLSDHRYIFFEHLNVTSQTLSFRNPRSTDWDLYSDLLATKFHGYSPTIETPNDLDDAVDITTSYIIEAYEEACPLRSIKTTRGTPWWNSELAKLRKQCRRSWNRRRTEGSESFRLARKAYKKALRSAERSGWKSLCTNVSSLSEASRLNKILAKSKDFQVSEIRKPNGDFTSSDEEVLEHLFETHFPGCVDLTSSDESTAFSVSFETLAEARRIVTLESIQWALNSFSPYKSPGADGIYPILLQKGFEFLKHVLKKLMVTSFATGYIPESWRDITVKFIPKGGRSSYQEAKSFRPISLSSFLLKCLERIIDHHIREVNLTNIALHVNQHAYQTGKSTTTLLHKVVYDIEKAFAQKQSCLGVFLDIEGAFDNVSFDAIIEAARYHGVPSIITNWIYQMLKNRNLFSTLRQAEISKLSVRGCPQGGVLSPLLWNLVADTLLRELNNKGFPTYGFADDYLILIVGLCISTLFDLMQNALSVVERWCHHVGLSVNPNKTSIVLFSEKRNLSGIRPLRLFGSEINVSSQVKYLGVILDSKLSWTAHIEFRVKKACMAFGQCRRTIGKTWGLKPKYIKWIYTTIVRPILAYGCLVWWQKGEVRTVQTKLSHLQRMCLMALSGAYSTTPTAALEALFDVAPLHIHLEQEALSCAYRLWVLGLWDANPVNRNSTHTSLLPRMVQWDKYILAPSDLTLNSSFPYRTFSSRFPSRNEWTTGYLERSISDSIVCYTDGSLLEGRAGAGVFSRELRLQESYSLGRYCTVFQAEIFAIMCGVQAALHQNVTGKVIYFCSDSQAAIKALTSASSRSKLVIACRTQIEELNSVNTVHLLWVPGHSSIAGNEWADELARTGASHEFIGPEPAIPISPCWMKLKISSWASNQHKEYWSSLESCRQTKLYLNEPSPVVSKYLIHLSKQNCSIVVKALTGHCRLNYHMANMQQVESSLCDSCESDYQTSYHLICNCPAVAQLRYRIFGKHLLSEIEFKQLNLKDILLFLSQCGKEL